MADEIDRANALAEADLERSIRAARQPIPAGVPGECDNCGDNMPRLVNGLCGYCRDGRRRSRTFLSDLLARGWTDRDESEPEYGERNDG